MKGGDGIKAAAFQIGRTGLRNRPFAGPQVGAMRTTGIGQKWRDDTGKTITGWIEDVDLMQPTGRNGSFEVSGQAGVLICMIRQDRRLL